MRLQCSGCGAALVVEEHLRTSACPYCGSHSVIERPATRDRPEPGFALPFALTERVARERVQAWLADRSWFCKTGVQRARLEDLRGVYVPAYIYSATARSRYSALIGEDYTETETYTTTDSQGRTRIQTRTVTKTEWRPLSGEHAAYVPDVLVTASTGLPDAQLEAIEPFDLRRARRMHPALLAGWTSEEPSLSHDACLERARAEAKQAALQRVDAFMPGDSHRQLDVHTELSEESTALALVPVWVLAASVGPTEPPFRILVNGQTGEVQGDAPLSWMKIAAAILALLLVLGAAALYLRELS